jgi:prepilin-type N-terminal cleavage/methylation domain-containing protein
MSKDLRKKERRYGFTIIELMTVLLIIGLIISVLVPGINIAKRHAKEVAQHAQLYSIKSSLEMFYNDYDNYPPSERTGSPPEYTCGAQKLAEALVGCDLQGYDPVSNFDLVNTDNNPNAYAIAGKNGATQQDEDQSLARRMGPYLQIDERTRAVDLERLFGVGGTGDLYPGGNPANKEIGPVLCDIYIKKKVALDPATPGDTVTVGAPLLYYKSSRSSHKFDTNLPNGNIYNSEDNQNLIDLGNLRLPLAQRSNSDHHFGTEYEEGGKRGMGIFYDAITNPAIKVGIRPYNPQTYIIISAGHDGIYGTRDDIANFGK